jgi:alpha-1,3-rhamnosyl/mannosyltransferase
MPHYVLDARTATPHFPGIGRYVTNLARSMIPLLAAGERLSVLYHPQHPLDLPASLAVARLPVAASPFGLAQQWQLPRLLHLLRADLYHSAYVVMPYFPRVPTVLTVYDLIPLLYPEQSSRRARLAARGANHLALRAARRVLAISEATRRDYIRHLGVGSDKIVTVPLAAEVRSQETGVRSQGSGVREQELRSTPQCEAFRWDAIRDSQHAAHPAALAPYALYLGSNKPHKNLVRLVEAWGIANRKSQITNHRLVIAGAWDVCYPEARQRAAALGLADKIVFLGPAAEAELPALYAGATLFVFPSLYEGFGLPVLEAMACGTPVVCSNTSSLPEVAGDAAILVDPLDVDVLAAAIGRALGDVTLRVQMRDKGLTQAARFSWAQTALRTLEIYRQAAQSAA